MRMTRFFGKTLRDVPAEAELASHKLMLSAGMIFRTMVGVYCYLHLALMSIIRIENIIREEMNAAGAQELRMSILQPREIWEESGRFEQYGPDMMRLTDRRGRSIVLVPTAEELVTKIVKANVDSYRDLPVTVYQIEKKFRDEPRPRGGTLRVREFEMKDAYSFDIDEDGLDMSYGAMVRVYKRIFERCGVETILAEADSGAIGGNASQEFILLSDGGEDTVIMCRGCEYAANSEKAESNKPVVASDDPLPLCEVHSPGVKTIDELCEYLGIPRAKTVKAVFYTVDGELKFVVIRGDLEVNEVKLSNVLGQPSELRLAYPEEIASAGVVAGSASPIGLDVTTIADDSVLLGSNFAVGANREDYHLLNANVGRDFEPDLIADIALAHEGDQCPKCDGTLVARRGIEVGHVFKLGTRYSEKLDARYIDSDGERRPIVMGCYGIGVGRLLAAAIEQNHDEVGIVFPPSIAPYDVHLVGLNTNVTEVCDFADSLYDELNSAGVSVLYDDRDESPGVKFNDADLIGLPLRVVASRRNLNQGAVEIRMRKSSESVMVPINKAVAMIQELMAANTG